MRAFLVLRKTIAHGGTVPRGWRLTWYEPRRCVGIYSPWPLHWVLRFGRECVHRTRRAFSSPSVEWIEATEMRRAERERQLLADEYSRGYLAGWRECFDSCVRAAVQDELASGGELWDVAVRLTGSASDEIGN